MTRLSSWAALCGCLFAPSAAQSISSCGGALDHLSNVVIKMSSDPIQRGTPFTISMSGDFDEDHVGGSVVADFEVKAFGVIDKKVSKTVPYTLSPGLPKGAQTLVIGPVSLPSDPGQVALKGQVRVKDPKGEPVACLNLDLSVPLADEARKTAALPAESAGELCAQAGDHLQNVSHSTAAGVTTVTATLDEDLPSLAVKVDLAVHALFVSIPVKVTVPIAYNPGLKHGDWKLVAGPVQGEVGIANAVTVTGQVVINDGKGEEVTCITVDGQRQDEHLTIV